MGGVLGMLQNEMFMGFLVLHQAEMCWMLVQEGVQSPSGWRLKPMSGVSHELSAPDSNPAQLMPPNPFTHFGGCISFFISTNSFLGVLQPPQRSPHLKPDIWPIATPSATACSRCVMEVLVEGSHPHHTITRGTVWGGVH